MKLKHKFILMACGLSVVLIIAMSISVLLAQNQIIQNAKKQYLKQQAQNLAKVCEESLLQDELIFANYIRQLKNQNGFLRALFVDQKGMIQMDSQTEKIGSPFLDLKILEIPITTSEKEWVVTAPVFFGGRPSGHVAIVFDKNAIKQEILNAVRPTAWSILMASLFSILLGIFGAVLCARWFVKPIETIVASMKKVSQGQLNPTDELKTNDELAWMIKELNIMVVKLKELDQMKQEFVSSVTHELNSPLMALQSFASLLITQSYGPLNAKQIEMLSILKNNVARLSTFINEVLTLSKLEAKRIDIFNEKFDLFELLKEVSDLYQPLADEKKLKFLLNKFPQPMHIFSDRIKLNHVCANLVSNAIKYTTHGSIEITADQHHQMTKIFVSDTGPGIPDQEKQLIFDKFYRSPSQSQQSKGTGLGLPIAKMFTQLMGGDILVEDRPGGGSIFVVTLNSSVPQNLQERI